jgi:hypothetical protein
MGGHKYETRKGLKERVKVVMMVNIIEVYENINTKLGTD